jgi:uncharacterized protein YciI
MMKTPIRLVLLSVLFVSCFNTSIGNLRAQSSEKSSTEYFVFLTSGKSAKDVPADKLQTKQQAHVGNFGTLAKENKLTLAGPMGDPKKFLRGVIMVNAPDVSTMEKYFDADPYVKEGFMKLEVNAIRKRIGDPSVLIKPEGLEELRIVVWDYAEADKQNRKIADDVLAEHEKHWQELQATGRVGLICRFEKDAPRFGIAILDSIPDTQIEEWLNTDPLVAQKLITFQLMPQYLSKGALTFPARK